MKSVRTAVRALALLGAGTPDLGVTDVARALRIPKSTASRLLAALGDEGLLEQDPATRRYRPGLLAFKLGELYRQRTSTVELVREAMTFLARRTGHSCWVAALAGTEVVILGNVHGGYPVRFVVEPGRRLPAHSTAIGKALLARLPDGQVRALFPTSSLRTLTDRTLRSARALLADLARVRTRGYAEVDQETFPGIKAIGVAFVGSDGAEPIGLSLSYPVSSVPRSGDRALVAALLETARWVGVRIGDPLWSAASTA